MTDPNINPFLALDEDPAPAPTAARPPPRIPDEKQSWDEYLRDDGLNAARGIVNALILAACFILACWLAWWGLQIARSALAQAAITTMDYLHTGPGCPGADPTWLGWCSEAPKGGL